MEKMVCKIFKFSIKLIIFLLCFLTPANIHIVPPLDAYSTTYELPQVKIGPDGFTIENKPFRFIGANAVNLVFYDDFNLDVEKAIRTAKENGIVVLRLFMDWGWGKPEDYDKILDLASRHGVYLILTLTDFHSSGEHLRLEKHFREHAVYKNFINLQTKRKFKKWIKQVITRQNSVNGRIYRDDTTIFAWDIGNEPEYWRFGYSEVNEWIQEMAKYIKSLDSNHLVTIGISTNSPEFDADGPLYEMLNVPELDFFSFHFYPVPANWNGDFLSEGYVEQIIFRTKKFLSMGKPVVMEEFDFSASGELNAGIKSNPETAGLYYRVIKESMDAAFTAGASGVMFWGWGVSKSRDVPLWWSIEDHNIEEEKFSALIREYQIPVSVRYISNKSISE